MKVVFMGTPEFAVPSLDILVQYGYEVVAVVTAPDKPAGRGQRLQESDVKKYALSKNIPVLQPLKMKDPDFIAELKTYKPDLQIVVAFRMLPEVVWSLPSLGTFNLHASLLPQYRGAAPINWVIINGEHETGATTFFLNHEIDKGTILFSEKIPVSDTETAGELHDRLMLMGADLVLKTVQAIQNGNVPLREQTESSDLKGAPKLFKEDCRLDWNQPVQVLYNRIRGLSPYPTAFTELNGQQLKVFSAVPGLDEEGSKAGTGTIFSDGKTYLRFKAADGYLDLKEIQLESKKKMSVEDFLKGYRIQPGLDTVTS